MSPLHGLIKVCILKDQQRRFASGLKRNVLHSAAGLLHDLLSCRRAAREGNLIDVRVLRNRGACDSSIAVENVHYSWRKTGFLD